MAPVSQRSRHVGARGTKELHHHEFEHDPHTVRILSPLGLEVAVLVAPAGARTAHADGLILRAAGTYAIEVTVRDCASGPPAGPVIPSLVTFHGDGSIFETQGDAGSRRASGATGTAPGAGPGGPR